MVKKYSDSRKQPTIIRFSFKCCYILLGPWMYGASHCIKLRPLGSALTKNVIPVKHLKWF